MVFHSSGISFVIKVTLPKLLTLIPKNVFDFGVTQSCFKALHKVIYRIISVTVAVHAGADPVILRRWVRVPAICPHSNALIGQKKGGSNPQNPPGSANVSNGHSFHLGVVIDMKVVSVI